MTAAAGGGSAVMARRARGAGRDDFPAPAWAVRALCEWLQRQGHPVGGCAVREPAAGRGHMARALDEYFAAVHESDIHDYGRADLRIADYLARTWSPIAWTVTNPPFRRAEEFCRHALASSVDGVAMLVRTQFLDGSGRFDRLFATRPPGAVLQFVERVAMLRGRLVPRGMTATAYCWVVWDLKPAVPFRQTRLVWLPRCRARLERPEDYA